MAGLQCLALLPHSVLTQQQARLFLEFFKQTLTMTTTTPLLNQKNDSVITEYGKQNVFAREVQMQFDEDYTNYPEEAEKANGRWAMVGFIALLGAYISTHQIIPGIF